MAGAGAAYVSPISTLNTSPVLRSTRASNSLPLSRPSTTSSTSSTPKIQLEHISPSEHGSQLASQRLNRPVSPHLSIYQPQITWYSGALMRNSAILITTPVYLFGAAYLFSPLFGWHLDTASLVEWFGSLSSGTRLAVKGVFGFPFCFHIVHGLRHLIWDTGMMLSNRQVAVSGWLGLGVSCLGTLCLMFW